MEPGAGGLPAPAGDVQSAGPTSQEEVTQRFQVCIESKTHEQRSEQRPEQGGDRGRRYSSGSFALLAGAPQVKGASGPDTSRISAAASLYRSVVGRPFGVIARRTRRARGIGSTGGKEGMDGSNEGQAAGPEVGHNQRSRTRGRHRESPRMARSFGHLHLPSFR